MRGDRKKLEEKGRVRNDGKVTSVNGIINIRTYRPKRIPQLMWRECIKKIWEVDPLVCPKCTGEMKIISSIYKRTVIKKILTHLKIYEGKKNQRDPPIPETDYTERVQIVPYDDGWPGSDEQASNF